MNKNKYVNICTSRSNWDGCKWLDKHPECSFSLCHNQNANNPCIGFVRMTEEEAITKGYIKDNGQ